MAGQMSSESQLAVLLRMAQWQCDALAFHLPEGEFSVEECQSTATTLETVAQLLRNILADSCVLDADQESVLGQAPRALESGATRGSSPVCGS